MSRVLTVSYPRDALRLLGRLMSDACSVRWDRIMNIIHSFIHSTNRWVLSTSYALGIVLDQRCLTW